MEEFNEKRWKALSQMQNIWESGCDDAPEFSCPQGEYVTLHPTPDTTDVHESQLVWDPSWSPIIQCLAQQPGLLRQQWWNHLCKLIAEWNPHGSWRQWYEESWDMGELTETWQSWWMRIRKENEPNTVNRAMWLIRTLVRNHPRLAVVVRLQGNGKKNKKENIPSHSVWIEEHWPLNRENLSFVKNLLQDLSAWPHMIPNEWVENISSITWQLVELQDAPTWEVNTTHAWAPDLKERWVDNGWNLSGWGCDPARFRAISFAWIDAWMHSPTTAWMSTTLHKSWPRHSWWLAFIWQRWMTYQTPVADRMRFILAGGMVKSCWHLRDASDVDFLVLDHHEKLEGRYHPNLGSPHLKLFHDFGKTYYACEQYFFPTRPEWFAAQKSFTSSIRKIQAESESSIDGEEQFGSDLIPKFSASGLKASRFFPLLQWMWDRYRHMEDEPEIPKLDVMDDLLTNPQWGFWRQGVHYVDLEWEWCRDHLKDLDLGWVSKKQISDVERWKSLYEIDDVHSLGWKLTPKGEYFPFLQWKWNIYHGKTVHHPETGDPAGFEVLIRRAPDCLHTIVKTTICQSRLSLMESAWTHAYKTGTTPEKSWRLESAPGSFVLHHWNDVWEQTNGTEFCIARQVLLSSLPSTISYDTKTIPAIWWWVLTEQGELHVQLWNHPWNLGGGIVRLARGDRWVASGLGQMEENDELSKWKFTLHRLEESQNIWGTEGEETELGCHNLSKILTILTNIFRMHKVYDVQNSKRWNVEFTHDKLIPDWESLPWIGQSRSYWEKQPWLDRWITIPQKNYQRAVAVLQKKNGWEFSQNPGNQLRKALLPKTRKQK